MQNRSYAQSTSLGGSHDRGIAIYVRLNEWELLRPIWMDKGFTIFSYGLELVTICVVLCGLCAQFIVRNRSSAQSTSLEGSRDRGIIIVWKSRKSLQVAVTWTKNKKGLRYFRSSCSIFSLVSGALRRAGRCGAQGVRPGLKPNVLGVHPTSRTPYTWFWGVLPCNSPQNCPKIEIEIVVDVICEYFFKDMFNANDHLQSKALWVCI